MTTLITTAFVLGIIAGLAAAYTIRDFLRRHAEIKVVTENKYLAGEVKRLRAQVASIIGKEEYSPAVFNEEVRAAA